MADDGWVKVHRKVQDWKYWRRERFTYGQAWIDMLLIANHKQNTFSVRGNTVTLKPGQIGHSEETLAGKWHWSRGKVRRFLKTLEIDQQIEQQKSFILNVITILNWESYQLNSTADSTAERQQTDTNKNVKNEKKKDYTPSLFSPAPAEKPLRRENGKHRFEDSPFYDPNEFRANLDWPPDVCDYWFDVLVNASAANSSLRYNDWLCVARQWKLREERGKR